MSIPVQFQRAPPTDTRSTASVTTNRAAGSHPTSSIMSETATRHQGCQDVQTIPGGLQPRTTLTSGFKGGQETDPALREARL